MLIRRHIHILSRPSHISKRRPYQSPRNPFSSTNMDVERVVGRRTRSPAALETGIEERPPKRSRLGRMSDTDGAEEIKRIQPKKKSKFNKRAKQKLVEPEE